LSKAVPGDRRVRAADRDQIHVNLLGLGPLLREHAARQGVSVGCAARIAISRMLHAEAGDHELPGDRSAAPQGDSVQGGKARLLLRLSPLRAEALLAQARRCGVSRSRYVEMLMDGGQPAALPADHAAMVAALMTSTDHIAVLCVDLRAFMRLLGNVPGAELQPYRARLRSLVDDVQAHLEPAARLLAELEVTRRWR